MSKQGSDIPTKRATGTMSLRKRLEKSRSLANVVGAIAWAYLAFSNRTTRWQSAGLDDLRKSLSQGPVLCVTWHSRTIMPSFHWPVDSGGLSSLHTTSPVARLIGVVQRYSGLQPMEMSAKQSNRAASRAILKRVKEGVSIGLTADGPTGPALKVKDAPLEWARITGMPIYCYAFSTTRSTRADTWDKMLVPKPFGRGAFVFIKLEFEVPRKADAAQLEELREQMRQQMIAATARADAMLGLPPGP
ncbi:lysophospholipid acyltransferase family protein [Yoonia sediminilitoris]|uniref:DUF374 domain-containing protein n=1 Tax=Yoonia sediminilitoris TaxID=1286148 RepID=A0A2T6K9L9_9RHOB|nr:DUF374 domain-containing protein [Yoonia sediminilitoris]PUB11502.1 hypothetical protein C8N45_11319 [Yoonia sediminilitoris]RCW91702.1 hypothetical protein DFP92_11319 [Yoonia sediminilitoris]